MDAEKTEPATLAKLNTLFAYCRERSAFYRERLPANPLHSLAELTQTPVLTPDELRQRLPPKGAGGLTGPLESSYAFASGGTTGQPKLVYYTAEELDREAAAIAYGLAVGGVRPGMVAANLMNAGHLWASFQLMNQALEKCRCHILPIAAQSGEGEALDFIRALGAEVAVGIPSFMISLAQRAMEQGVNDAPLRIIATGGEHFLDAGKAFVRAHLGVERFISAGYSSNDTGPIAFQCSECTGGIHHLFEETCHVEVVDETSLLPVPPGETGKLVITKLQKWLMPVIRYDIGDRGRYVSGECACGRTQPRIELLGRSDDILNIGGYNVTPDYVAAALEKTPGLSPHFRMIARADGPLVLLCVECEAAVPCREEAARQYGVQLGAQLLETVPALKFLVNIKGIAMPRMTVLQPGALPRNPRTGKIRRVIDERLP